MSALCVIMPAYNEEGAIREAVAEVRTSVLDTIDDARLIVVNDGSRDATGAILDELAAEDPRIRVIHKANGGHGPALMEGLSHADGEWVFLVDSDRQMPLEPVARLWDAVHDGWDAAFGVRRKRDDPPIRRALTRAIRGTLPLLFGVRLHDANVPYKLFRRSTWEEARAHIPADTLAPSLFLAVYMRTRGMRIAEIDIDHRERETGEVSIRRWKLVKFCGRAFGQLLDFRRSIRT
jgi:glycosyltransferase involved in cell wall biosynthesis